MNGTLASQLGIKKTVFFLLGRRGLVHWEAEWVKLSHSHGVAPCLVTCFSCSPTSPRRFEMHKCLACSSAKRFPAAIPRVLSWF